MQVIEFRLKYNNKDKNNKINSLIKTFFEKSVDEKGNSYSDIKEYKKDVNSKWSGSSKNIKFLAKNKTLLISDKYSDREYYIFSSDSMTNISTSVELTIILISPYNNIQENIIIVLERLKTIKVKSMSFEINYQTRGRMYIYDSLISDIKDIGFCLEIQLKKNRVISLIKEDIYKFIVLIGILVIAYLIYSNQIYQCYRELTEATDETIKLFTNTKIAIIVNLVTGLAGTCFIEFILLVVSFIKYSMKNNLLITIEPDVAVNIFEEYVRKGTFENVAEGIDEDIPIISDNILNEVKE